MRCIDDEIPFEIPRSWIWVRLKDVCDYLHRGKSPSYSLEKKLPVIAQKCNQWDKIYTDRCLFIDPKTISKYTEEQFVQVGDTIINSTGGGTVGRTGYVDDYVFSDYSRFVADSHITVVRGNNLLCKKYLYYFLTSPFIQIGLEDRCSGSTNQIELGTDTIRNYLLPLPPCPEQQRIVDKLEEAIPVVDVFSQTQLRLDNLNNAIAGLLKKSILQEAIKGKLVSQDPNDEPAEELLKRIQREKEKLVAAGKIKAKDVVNSIIFKGDNNKYYEQINDKYLEISEEIPFDIPDSWTWCRFGEYVKMKIGKTPARGFAEFWNNGVYPWVSISDMTDYGVVTSTKEKISEIAAQNQMGEMSPIGTLLMSFKLTVGRTSILNVVAYHNEAIISVFPFVDENNYTRDYLFYILPLISNLGDSKDAIKGKTLNSQSLNKMLLPIPPLHEQKRIVDKIRELFGYL